MNHVDVTMDHSYCHARWSLNIPLNARASGSNCLSAAAFYTRVFSTVTVLWDMFCLIQKTYLRKKKLALDALSVLFATVLSAGLNEERLKCGADGRHKVDEWLLSMIFQLMIPQCFEEIKCYVTVKHYYLLLSFQKITEQIRILWYFSFGIFSGVVESRMWTGYFGCDNLNVCNLKLD